MTMMSFRQDLPNSIQPAFPNSRFHPAPGEMRLAFGMMRSAAADGAFCKSDAITVPAPINPKTGSVAEAMATMMAANSVAAACRSSMDAAKAAVAVHYSNVSAYPGNFSAMTTANELDIPTNATVTNGTPPAVSTVVANGWTLTMTPGAGNAAPTFACT